MKRRLKVADVVKLRKQEDVKGLIEVINNEHNTIKVRCRAVKGLGVIGNDVCVQTLLDFTRNENEQIRCAAVNALSLIGNKYHDLTIPVLSALLQDDSWEVIEEAVISLSKIDSVSVIEPLVNMLKTTDDYGLAVHIGGEFINFKKEETRNKAAELLLELFKEQTPNLLAAGLALNFLSVPHTFETIRPYMKDTNIDIRYAATEAIAGCGTRSIGPLLSVVADIELQLSLMAIEKIFDMWDPPYCHLHDKTTFKKDFNSDDAELKFSAALVLSEQGDKKSIDLLIYYLLDSPNQIARELVISQLGSIGYNRPIPALQKALEKETDEKIKSLINSALESIALQNKHANNIIDDEQSKHDIFDDYFEL